MLLQAQVELTKGSGASVFKCEAHKKIFCEIMLELFPLLSGWSPEEDKCNEYTKAASGFEQGCLFHAQTETFIIGNNTPRTRTTIEYIVSSGVYGSDLLKVQPGL